MLYINQFLVRESIQGSIGGIPTHIELNNMDVAQWLPLDIV